MGFIKKLLAGIILGTGAGILVQVGFNLFFGGGPPMLGIPLLWFYVGFAFVFLIALISPSSGKAWGRGFLLLSLLAFLLPVAQVTASSISSPTGLSIADTVRVMLEGGLSTLKISIAGIGGGTLFLILAVVAYSRR